MQRLPSQARFPRLALLVTTLTLAACAEQAAPGAPQLPSASLVGDITQDPVPSQMAVAAAVPGFGGYYLDAAGRPTVHLTNPALGAAAATALSGFLADRGFTAADLQVVQGQFEYAQLDAWYRLSKAAAFSVDGIVLGDVDEGRNRIRFGVTNASAGAAVLSAVTALGVPAGAVVIEERAPVATVATLREVIRPLMGGVQINFFPTPPVNAPGVSLLCTYGFNIEIYGTRGFVTNSHCSNVEGGEETPTAYYQSRRSTTTNFIGTETDDPHWTSYLNLDCPPPFGCRYSDALRATLADTVGYTLGRIARPNEITTTLADTTHDIAGYFTIKSERQDPVQGEVANKVGRTTGWTNGVTTGTCIDVLALGTSHIRLCQAMVGALVDGGDSGSPVFFRRGNQSSITLLGVLWGGSVDEANPEFVYSPLSGIRRELGNFRTF